MTGIRLGRSSLVVLVAMSIAGCTTSGAGAPSASPLAASATVAATTEPAATEPAPTDDVAAPPAASLAAEGGDPVTGQLGTYVWAGGGSESPWLRGAPLTVGAHEPLTVAFQPTIDVASWTARFVPSTATDPAGARSLGHGTGVPRFGAPEAGSWTVEVHAEFGDGAGSASYFWEVAVR